MIVLIDNGHGVDTNGKRSPDGKLREYAWARDVAERLEKALKRVGVNATRIVPEEYDISIGARAQRVNSVCREFGAKNVLLVSIHNNAAGADGKWHTAQGWSAHISLNASLNSKTLARCLIKAHEDAGFKVRKYSNTYPFWQQNLGICRMTNCPAVLTENLFMDNREDCADLLTDACKDRIVAAHVKGILSYIK